MAAVQRKLVHKQFNSPMGLYSQQNVKETLDRELKAFGSEGIEIDDQIARPLNLANSAVLRAVEEEEQMKCGYKRVAWPPASEERIVREFTPQPQTQFQPATAYNQQQQPSAAPGASVVPPTQGPIYNNVQHNTNNNFARDTNMPNTQNPNENENDYEAFPPQTPETPIILKDKQFSRLPSQEPNTVPYQQYQQPQNQSIQQQHFPREQPHYQQSLQHQQNYQPNQQNVAYPQQQQQQHQYQHPQEEHHYQHHQPTGWKTIRPPQTIQNTLFTSSPGVGETTSTVASPICQQQYQNYHQTPTNQQQQYRAPSYDNYQQQPQQYQPHPQQPQQQQYQPQHQQYPPQPQYQAQAPQNQYQQAPQTGSHYQQPPYQPAWAQQQPQPAQQQQQQQYQQPPWVQQPQQQPYQQQQQQQPQYQNPLNQYNQAPFHQQQHQYPPQQNQFVPQTNQQQFNSYSQPQQQQHTVSHDQVDQQQQPYLAQDQRGTSPGIITLRKEAPITQKPAPVYSSQPAAISFRESSTDSLGGSSMRGDLKWPPPEYKEAAVKENEERRKLALGPACRPRKVHRDYTPFFAKNALSHHYPSYKVPPGTQHMTY